MLQDYIIMIHWNISPISTLFIKFLLFFLTQNPNFEAFFFQVLLHSLKHFITENCCCTKLFLRHYAAPGWCVTSSKSSRSGLFIKPREILMQETLQTRIRVFPWVSFSVARYHSVCSDLMVIAVELEKIQTLQRDWFMLVASRQAPRKLPKLQHLSYFCVIVFSVCTVSVS